MSQPLVSVIVPTYDRLPILRKVFAAYELQVPGDLPFEIVAVDDGSSDGSRDFLRSYASQRYRLHVVEQPNRGPAAARNRALDVATGALILFTGDDVVPSTNLLLEHCRGHLQRRDSSTAILGLTQWPDDLELTTTMRHIDGQGAQQFSYSNFTDGAEYDFRHFYTSNVSLRRDFLDLEPTYFSTAFPAAAFEDAELAWRLSAHGLRICYRAAAVADHYHPYSASTFFQRQIRCGEMAAILANQRPELEKWLGLNEIEWGRLRSLAAPLPDVADKLDTWEHRIICLAQFCDLLDGPAADSILLAVFGYGYQKGLSRALYGDHESRHVRAVLLAESFPSVVSDFRVMIEKLRLRWPAADLLALEKLANDP